MPLIFRWKIIFIVSYQTMKLIILFENSLIKILIQSERFGAGCYIEISLSYHQPHQHRFVGR